MSRYYFFLCALPSLSLDRKPDISYEELQVLLQINLNSHDASLVQRYRQLIDCKNLQYLWMKRPLYPGGNLSEKEMSEALMRREIFPEYVFSFINTHEDILYRLKDFPYLLSEFFRRAIPSSGSFLKKYFTWERDVAVVLASLRAKERGKALSKEIQYEDPYDFLVSALLSQDDGKDTVEVPEEYAEVKTWFMKYHGDPKALYRAYMEYRLEKIEEMAESNPFSMDQVLSYLARYQVVLEWNESNIEEGKTIVEGLVRGKI